MSTQESIQGEIQTVRVRNNETGWTVVDLLHEEEKITAIGLFPPIDEGILCNLEGDWVHHHTYGKQFKAETVRIYPPKTTQGIERFLRSGAVEGIGKVYAEKVVRVFGERTLQVLEDQPWQLDAVSGIGKKRRKAITQGLKEYRNRMEVMSFLHTSLGPARANQVYEKYGDESRERIAENPYRVIREFTGFGFTIADALAKTVGVNEENPLRLEAAIHHVLNELTLQGHTASFKDDIAIRVERLLGSELSVRAIEQMDGSDSIIQFDVDGRTVVQNERFLKLETDIARELRRLRSAEAVVPAIDGSKAIPWVEERVSMEFESIQKAAISKALSEKVLIITGGPGVGKTTIQKALIKIWHAKRQVVHLAAPTGRAARRMSESTGSEATTIHRLLEAGGYQGFKRNKRNRLAADIVLLDECSMVDTYLLRALLVAMPNGARLIMVGDQDQLPSVGPGQVLADLIASGFMPVVRLEKPFRQASQSMIVRNAHLVNHGEVPPLDNCVNEFVFIETDSGESTREKILEVIESEIRGQGGDPLRDVMTLTPMHKGPAGTIEVNASLQNFLNPNGDRVGAKGLRIGDRVIQTKNNSDLGVSNGDVGVVVGVSTTKSETTVRFDDKDVCYPKSEAEGLQLAYAITIHKSQGSEYGVVIVVCDRGHSALLSRQLIYTAITRAKRKVVMIGQRRALHLAVSEARAVRRNTRLKDLLSDMRLEKVVGGG